MNPGHADRSVARWRAPGDGRGRGRSPSRAPPPRGGDPPGHLGPALPAPPHPTEAGSASGRGGHDFASAPLMEITRWPTGDSGGMRRQSDPTGVRDLPLGCRDARAGPRSGPCTARHGRRERRSCFPERIRLRGGAVRSVLTTKGPLRKIEVGGGGGGPVGRPPEQLPSSHTRRRVGKRRPRMPGPEVTVPDGPELELKAVRPAASARSPGLRQSLDTDQVGGQRSRDRLPMRQCDRRLVAGPQATGVVRFRLCVSGVESSPVGSRRLPSVAVRRNNAMR